MAGRRGGIFLLAAALCAALTAGSASAQRWENRKTVDTGSNIRKQAPAEPPYYRQASPSEKARFAVNQFALCRTERVRVTIERYLLDTKPADWSDDGLQRIMGPYLTDCLMGGDVETPYEIMMGSTFLAVLRLKYRDAERMPALTAVDYRALHDVTDAKGSHYIATREFAQCVVMAAPKETAELLFSRELSPAETAAVQKVAPYLGPCLPQGTELKFSRAMLFGFLAEAMYRSAEASGAGPA